MIAIFNRSLRKAFIMGGKNSRIYERISRSKIDLEDDNDVIQPLPEPAAPEPTDPRLLLTTRQVYRLKKSWKGIKRQMGPTGIELFIRYSVIIFVFWLRLVI